MSLGVFEFMGWLGDERHSENQKLMKRDKLRNSETKKLRNSKETDVLLEKS